MLTTSPIKSLADIESLPDMEYLCSIIIVNPNGAFFPTAAQSVLKALVMYCIDNKMVNWDDLLRIVNSDLDEIKKIIISDPFILLTCKFVEHEDKITSFCLQIIKNSLTSFLS